MATRDAERIVVAHYLVRRRADIRDARVHADNFRDPEHRRMWALAQHGSALTPADLGMTPDQAATLAALRPSPRDVMAAEADVIRSWQLRHIAGGCHEIAEQARGGDLDAEAAILRTRTLVAEAEAGGIVEAKTHRDVGVDLFRSWSDAIASGKQMVLPMPVAAIARAVGGWQRGKFYLVGAVTSAHKTTFGRQSAWHLASCGHRALLWPMEDSAQEMAARTFAAEVKSVDTRTFTTYQKPEGIESADFERMIDDLGRHLDTPAATRLRYVDERLPTLGRVLAVVSAESARGLDAVVLDFMQLIQPDDTSITETAHWFQVSNALAALAERLGVALIATVQPTQEATREHERRHRPLTLSDLRGGSAIAQSAYGAALINRVWKDGQVDRRWLDIKIAKWKNASPTTIRVSVEPHKDRIGNEKP